MIENLNGIHETVKYKENSNVKLFINAEAEDYPIHWHTPMEIIMPLEGGYTVQIGDDLVHLNESDIIFIASGVKHRLIAPDTGKRLILQIEWSAVSKIKELNSILTLIAPAITLTPETSGDIHSNIRKLLLDIADEYQTDSFLSEAAIYSKMLEVLVLIGRHHTASSCNFNVGRHKQQEYLERFLSICEYIDAHCTEDITLDEIAKIAGFSKYHFTRLFKQFTNNTFYKYLNQKRIELALTLLADPNISVTETAMQSGFANPSSFIRVFKAEKGCTPTEFRKMFIG